MKSIQKDNKNFYQCEACGFLYSTQELAERCEKWCREHKSCNLEIIKLGIPPEKWNTRLFNFMNYGKIIDYL